MPIGRPSVTDFTNPDILSDLVDYYTQGAPTSILARHYQCASSTVLHHLRAAGVTIRPRGGRSNLPTPAALAHLANTPPPEAATPDPQPRTRSSAMPWADDALCRTEGNPESFYPEGGGAAWRAREAKKVCRRCPVLKRCATWALQNREPWGVWGGLSEGERRAILRQGDKATKRAAA